MAPYIKSEFFKARLPKIQRLNFQDDGCIEGGLETDFKLKIQMQQRQFQPVLRIRIRIQLDSVFLGHPDTDPYPGKYRTWILYPQKDPCNSNFLAI